MKGVDCDCCRIGSSFVIFLDSGRTIIVMWKCKYATIDWHRWIQNFGFKVSAMDYKENCLDGLKGLN